MELKISKKLDENGEWIVDNFVITEMITDIDPEGNPYKKVLDSGQHTIASILGNVERIKDEIDLKLAEKNQWMDKLNAVENFLNQ